MVRSVALVDPGPMQKSYARGATDVPLLDETIGASLRRTVAQFPDRYAVLGRD